MIEMNTDKIKQHLRDNKTHYIWGSVTVVVAGITCVIVKGRCSSHRIDRGISVVADRGISVIADRSVVKDNVFHISKHSRRGAPSWIVRCVETGEVFSSQREAAEAMGLSQSEISKHLNGLMDHVRGFTFERIAMAA